MYRLVTGFKTVLYIDCQFPHLVNILTKLPWIIPYFDEKYDFVSVNSFKVLFSGNLFLSIDVAIDRANSTVKL